MKNPHAAVPSSKSAMKPALRDSPTQNALGRPCSPLLLLADYWVLVEVVLADKIGIAVTGEEAQPVHGTCTLQYHAGGRVFFLLDGGEGIIVVNCQRCVFVYVGMCLASCRSGNMVPWEEKKKSQH